jgi:predicted CopG family antitoxin
METERVAKTTLAVSYETRDRLAALAKEKDESFEEIIKRLLDKNANKAG